MRQISIILAVFLALSAVSIPISGAPIRVHAVDIFALFVAYVVPGLFALNKETQKQLYIWFLGAIVGLFIWDALSAYVVVKREIFMGWYVVYPFGVLGILLLQLATKYIIGKLPYNKASQPTPKNGAAEL